MYQVGRIDLPFQNFPGQAAIRKPDTANDYPIRPSVHADGFFRFRARGSVRASCRNFAGSKVDQFTLRALGRNCSQGANCEEQRGACRGTNRARAQVPRLSGIASAPGALFLMAMVNFAQSRG
jgi:hypothetical protein